MSILSFIDRFSFKQIFSIAILLAILFAVPTTVWLVRQQTRLYLAAHKEKLPSTYVVEEEPFGQPSAYPPKIERLKPFLGKVDDVVFIMGKNFGQNPRERAIFFGGVQAHEEDILRWHDDFIEVMVPEGATSGLVKVLEVDKEDTYALPFIVYNPQTKTRVFWQANNLIMENGLMVVATRVILTSGQTVEKKLERHQMITTLVENLPSRDILHLTLYDNQGTLVPFYVNPTDFGF